MKKGDICQNLMYVLQMQTGLLKAKVIRYIPAETAAIFSLANLYLKQGIG